MEQRIPLHPHTGQAAQRSCGIHTQSTRGIEQLPCPLRIVTIKTQFTIAAADYIATAKQITTPVVDVKIMGIAHDEQSILFQMNLAR